MSFELIEQYLPEEDLEHLCDLVDQMYYRDTGYHAINIIWSAYNAALDEGMTPQDAAQSVKTFVYADYEEYLDSEHVEFQRTHTFSNFTPRFQQYLNTATLERQREEIEREIERAKEEARKSLEDDDQPADEPSGEPSTEPSTEATGQEPEPEPEQLADVEPSDPLAAIVERAKNAIRDLGKSSMRELKEVQKRAERELARLRKEEPESNDLTDKIEDLSLKIKASIDALTDKIRERRIQSQKQTRKLKVQKYFETKEGKQELKSLTMKAAWASAKSRAFAKKSLSERPTKEDVELAKKHVEVFMKKGSLAKAAKAQIITGAARESATNHGLKRAPTVAQVRSLKATIEKRNEATIAKLEELAKSEANKVKPTSERVEKVVTKTDDEDAIEFYELTKKQFESYHREQEAARDREAKLSAEVGKPVEVAGVLSITQMFMDYYMNIYANLPDVTKAKINNSRDGRIADGNRRADKHTIAHEMFDFEKRMSAGVGKFFERILNKSGLVIEVTPEGETVIKPKQGSGGGKGGNGGGTDLEL